MANCKECIHNNVCRNYEPISYSACSDFKDKSRYIELPCKPIPLMKDKSPFNSDVYCPYCGTNLSGYYGIAPQSINQCFNCGEFLDNTKSVTYEETEKALREREKE